jgi:hypothetical protein
MRSSQLKENVIKPKKEIERLVSKSLLMVKQAFVLTFKNMGLKKTNQKSAVPNTFYLRYLNHFFIGVSCLNASLSSFPNKISFFLKSALHLNLKTTNWINLNIKSFDFLGINTKKILSNLHQKKPICLKTFSPLRKLKREFLKMGILNQKPKAILYLTNLYTNSIINWYNNFSYGLFVYYYKTSNYKKLVYNLYYFFKWSLLQTLKKKHKKSLEKVVIKHWKKKNNIFTNDLSLQNFSNDINVFENLLYIYQYKL